MSTDILVATCGNSMAGDDAFGPLVGERLRAMALPDLRVVDLDIKPAALLDHLPGPRTLILVDAAVFPAQFGGPLLQWDLQRQPLPELAHDDALSSHGMGLADQIELARTLGVLPEIVQLVAAPVEDLTMGCDRHPHLSEFVQEAARLVVQIALQSQGEGSHA